MELAIHQLDTLKAGIEILRKGVGRKDVPAYWLEFLLVVATAGPAGINQMDAYAQVGMLPGIASRVVKLMSKYEDTTGKMEGYDLIKIGQDTLLRHRKRLFLSKKGLALVAEIIKR